MDSLEKQTKRDQWGSRTGFILAAMGSAVGLGNIWKFPYVAGANGGGAFLFLYILFVLLIGIPVMLAEFSIGRNTQRDVVHAFQKLAPKSPWVLAGILGVVATFFILSFYSVVAGWTLNYIAQYTVGGLGQAANTNYGEYFSQFISHPLMPIFWQTMFMILTVLFVYKGIKNGIEKLNKVLMPTLAVLIVGLAIYSLNLDGAMDGLKFLFQPDWSVLKDPSVYLAALGQAFFSLSLGLGALITYGSYLSKEEKLPSASLTIASLDTVFAIIAGLLIFPAVFTFNIEPGAGPGLVFITLPDIFGNFAYGQFVAITFFFLLAAAALSSAVSLLEVTVAFVIRQLKWTREKTAIFVGVLVTLVGIPSSLSLGIWSEIKLLGNLNIMDSIDYVASNIFLPLGGLLISMFVGWGWNKRDVLSEVNFQTNSLGTLWLISLRYITPIAIFCVLLYSLGII
ncbi:sodium-dependent transporter [Salirhabdus salicampi]|uniref:sodium-dependent transporter n=1 Tax=Salirhabdus salicampi TaxID=476102 RepID=UPI0020C51FD5|nr:sodium-dependent transporter [Salirhabdus salicampi]MCP8616171.1 sodium-dependent transporter [Salirhabdus salicampi]